MSLYQEALMNQRVRRDFTNDFKREAVRFTQASGHTIRQVADDLWIDLSTLTRWKRKLSGTRNCWLTRRRC